jgi:hypothetical protein
MTRRHAALTLASALSAYAAKRDAVAAPVRLHRLPDSAIQPQAAIDPAGTLHLVYYTGDARHGNLFYTRSTDGGATFSRTLPVNQGGSAIAAGTIRGAQLALGKSGRVHVAWNGSTDDGPLNPDSGKPGAPMLYARLNDSGNAFEPQRNLMLHSFGLDGGGSVAADGNGDVYVAWHGIGQSEATAAGKEGEARRRVWVTASADGGRTFAAEAAAWAQDTGACGCCGMKTFVNNQGDVFALYRSATQSLHRDIYLLRSSDRGRTFQGKLLHKWDINACPMSSMDFAENAGMLVCAWETGGQIYWTRITGASGAGAAGDPIAAPGEGKGRKHPRLAVNGKGEILLVWTEGTGWQKGGALAYQLYDPNGRPATDLKQVPGIPTWSFAAAIALPDNRFSVLY